MVIAPVDLFVFCLKYAKLFEVLNYCIGQRYYCGLLHSYDLSCGHTLSWRGQIRGYLSCSSVVSAMSISLEVFGARVDDLRRRSGTLGVVAGGT